MKLSLIHPSRSRPGKSVQTIDKWINNTSPGADLQLIVSLDEDDDVNGYINTYSRNWLLDPHGPKPKSIISNKNRSCVDAINRGAEKATGDILIVVSDDTDCFPGWDTALLKELEGKSDYLLKTDDGIQDYIVTMTVMDRKYYERDGHIYHPDYFHQFADTWLTVLADIRGRLIKSPLKFPHLHPGHSGGKLMSDALNHRNDLSWKDGLDTFKKHLKALPPGDLKKITDKSMIDFIRNYCKIPI